MGVFTILCIRIVALVVILFLTYVFHQTQTIASSTVLVRSNLILAALLCASALRFKMAKVATAEDADRMRRSEDRKQGPWCSDTAFSRSMTLCRKRDGNLRFCRRSQIFKPDRCHYDRRSQCCVLELDHYNPWFDVTIGFSNYKYFYLTLMYLVAYLCVLACGLSKPIMSGDRHISSIVSLIVAALLLPAPSFLLFIHTKIRIFRGMTSVEYFEFHCSRNEGPNDALHSNWRESPFDLGPIGNAFATLGPNPLLWLLPTRLGMREDGDAYFNPDAPDRSYCDISHPLVKRHMAELAKKKNQ